jgi:hypothetical protein
MKAIDREISQKGICHQQDPESFEHKDRLND